ncbi:beta-3 adrenergic receptor isoform X1 [Stigmatopora nigra]
MDIGGSDLSPQGCWRAAAVNSSQKSESETCIPVWMQSLILVLIVLMFLGSVTGNLLVIILVAATKTLHHVTSVLIINLAISDLLVGLGVMPFVALSLVQPGWARCFVRNLPFWSTCNKFIPDFLSIFLLLLEQNLCLFAAYTSSIYCTVSVLTLAAIALDRYHSIVDCLRYGSRCTPWRKSLEVLWIWLQAVATSSPPLLGWSSVTYAAPTYSCATDWAGSPGYTATVSVLSYFAPAIVILFCYAKIVKVARNHTRRVRSLEDSIGGCGNLNVPSTLVCHLAGRLMAPAQSDIFPLWTSPPRQQQRQGVARLFLVISAFFLCWTPYIGIALFRASEGSISLRTTRVPPCALTISYFLLLLNSDFNPLLYALLSKRFQVALRALSQKLRAGMRSVTNQGGEADPRRPTSTRPGSTSGTDNSCSPIFTISTDFRHHSSENICKEVAGPSCSSSFQDPCGDKKMELLQVPCRTQEGGRLPGSASTMEPKATFVFGQITVEVEHIPSENLLKT